MVIAIDPVRCLSEFLFFRIWRVRRFINLRVKIFSSSRGKSSIFWWNSSIIFCGEFGIAALAALILSDRLAEEAWKAHKTGYNTVFYCSIVLGILQVLLGLITFSYIKEELWE